MSRTIGTHVTINADSDEGSKILTGSYGCIGLASLILVEETENMDGRVEHLLSSFDFICISV
jgi:hypothetical protein